MIKFNYDSILGVTYWFFPKKYKTPLPKQETRIKNRKKRKIWKKR
jgi:hypothetical protein